MRGVSYLIDEAGNRTAVVIDLQLYGAQVNGMLQELAHSESDNEGDEGSLFTLKKDPLAYRAIIDYPVEGNEDAQRPYGHVDNAAEYVRSLRASEW